MSVERATTIVAVGLAAAALFVFLSVSSRRRVAGYGVETDFYGDYAPDAVRLRTGQFPLNEFQGPGYPAVLAVVETMIPDPFLAGRVISAVCAAASGLLAYALFTELFGGAVGLSSELLLLAGGVFPTLALTASTDMLFLALCLAAFAAFGSRVRPSVRILAAGMIAGGAFLVRYNGVFLLPALVVGILVSRELGRTLGARLGHAGLLLAGALLVALPWFYANARHTGSPLFNSNYLNVATEFYGARFGADATGDGTGIMSRHFHSLGEVLRFDPARIVRHYPVNLATNVSRSFTTHLVGPFIGVAAIVGALFLARTGPRTALAAALATGWLVYMALLGLTHWDARYYLFAGALYAGLAACALWRLCRWAAERLGSPRSARWAAAPLVLLFGAVSARASVAQARAFLRADPVEVLDACEALRARGAHGARILERKPHLAFVCGQTDAEFPLLASVDELGEWVRQHPADYVVMSAIEAGRRRGLAELRDPARAPEWLEPVYVRAEPLFILYAVNAPRLAGHDFGAAHSAAEPAP